MLSDSDISDAIDTELLATCGRRGRLCCVYERPVVRSLCGVCSVYETLYAVQHGRFHNGKLM